MFEKFKNEDTDPEITEVPKPEVKSFSQDLPVQASASDADPASIIKQIKDNPEERAVFENCDSGVWNEVYKAVAQMKLHPKIKWDSDSKVITFR
tara:strand:+ start:198 stop:479 length:282 start_codon:yes stop_codon:yes gene_type:complete